jgi:hypothetical protein
MEKFIQRCKISFRAWIQTLKGTVAIFIKMKCSSLISVFFFLLQGKYHLSKQNENKEKIEGQYILSKHFVINNTN